MENTHGAALLARLRELAAAAGEDPADWLEDAARCRAACKEIVAVLYGLPLGDGASPATCERIMRLAIGPVDRAMAAQVRDVVTVTEAEYGASGRDGARDDLYPER